jgi:hypothetical protein
MKSASRPIYSAIANPSRLTYGNMYYRIQNKLLDGGIGRYG